MRPGRLVVPCLLVLTCLAVVANPAGAIENKYSESFATKEYCDAVNTTALWDTVAGELRLPPFQITLAGSYNTPGSALGVAISGDCAYVADYGSGLQVIDITNPSSPVLAGSYDTPGYAWGVAISGDYAYVADLGSGLQVIDITNPSSPVLAGSYNTPGSAYAVAISGDYAYIADYSTGLQVIDITDPSSPVLAGSCDTPGSALGVAISGDYAYVADYGSGLQVIDITNPSSPVLAGSYNTPGTAYGVAISGDYAYVADYSSGLQVIDITNPSSPVLAGSCSTPGGALGVAISGDYSCVADYGSGLQMIDITNPSSPMLVGSYDTPGNAYGVAISGDYACVADYGPGLQVMDVADPLSPVLAGSYDTPGYAYDVAISGDYAYVADYGPGLQVIDITNPWSPVLAGSYNTPGAACDVAISGDYAYVGDHISGLQVIDITNPSSPVLAGSYNTPGYANGAAISGDYAYVVDGSSGLQVIDITNPSSPVLAGSYDTPGTALGVAISGDYAYVADEASGLQVIDITDPSSPVLAGSYDTPGTAVGVAISGDYAYVADFGSGLQVIDITNPSSPVLAGNYDTPGMAYDVEISGDYAYVADYSSGLQAIDITNPSSPVLAGSYNTPGTACGVAISGDYAYVTDDTYGLQVIWVCQQAFAIQANTGRSLAIDDSDNTILKVRLTSDQTDSINWEVSANGGTNWMAVSRDSTWDTPGVPGRDLMWRSTHYYVDPGVNPTCADLSIDWLYSFAAVDSIADIPGDQGGWVRLFFARSAYDFADASPPVQTYYIWRQVGDALLTAKAVREGVPLDSGHASLASGLPPSFACASERHRAVALGERVFLLQSDDSAGDSNLQGFPPGTWEVVGSVPALQQDQYIAAVPTLGDSASSGIVYTVYCVSAHPTTPSIWYVSPPDSGYSIDNLAPSPPGGLAMTSPTALAWDESEEEDFDYFTVYGSEVPGLDSTAGLIGYTSGTTIDVTGHVYIYYHVTATDFAGNQGEASSVENAYSGVTPGHASPTVFALMPSWPNPFSSRTSVRFDVPVTSAVSLKVFDAQGKQVKVLADEVYAAGRHTVTWAGDDVSGRPVGSGIYFVQMKGRGFEATSKVLLAR